MVTKMNRSFRKRSFQLCNKVATLGNARPCFLRPCVRHCFLRPWSTIPTVAGRTLVLTWLLLCDVNCVRYYFILHELLSYTQ